MELGNRHWDKKCEFTYYPNTDQNEAFDEDMEEAENETESVDLKNVVIAW